MVLYNASGCRLRFGFTGLGSIARKQFSQQLHQVRLFCHLQEASHRERLIGDLKKELKKL